MGYRQHVYSTSHAACIEAYEWDLELANNNERSSQLANEPDTFAGSYGDDYEDDEYKDIPDEHNEEGMFVVMSFPSLELFIDVNTNLDDMLLYSDSEDERDDNETTEIDSWRQCVDVPDEQVPHPLTRPTSATFPNPPKDTRIEIIPFPLESAGAPIMNPAHQQTHYEAYHAKMSNADNCYTPFCSKIDWEIVRWAKSHGPSSTAVTELLAIDSVCSSCSFSILDLLIVFQLSEKLSLSYKNAQELNLIFAHKLPC